MATTQSKINWPPERAISFNISMKGKEYMEVAYDKENLTMAEYEARFGGEER